MAIRWSRRVWFRVLGLCLGLVVLVGFLLPAIPPNIRHTSEMFFCQRCGVRRVVTQVGEWRNGESLDNESQIVPTDLSVWYEAHYPSPCQHIWKRHNISSEGYRTLGPFRIRAGTCESGSSRTPSLLQELGEQERNDLDKRYATDKAACQEYIAQALK